MIDLAIHKRLDAPAGDMQLAVEMTIERGSFVTLYGKSGAGKTSVLRMLAGLMKPDRGRVEVNNAVWFNNQKNINLTPQKRKVGFVFQDYALFPHMTVKKNLTFALEKGQNQQTVEDLIEIMELGDLQYRKPDTLSGGQQQRIALARALVQKPQLLMLDEPLSSLDNEIRHKLQGYILKVHQEFELTTILISHDVSEILKMSDYMFVIEDGKIDRKGSPAEVFGHKEMSGKFQFTGEVVAMEKQDFMFIVSILIGKDLVKVIVNDNEAKTLSIGDSVLVASKAFNPVIRKLL